MNPLDGGRPGDVRGFVHKKIGRFVKKGIGIVSGLNIPVLSPLAGIASNIIPGGSSSAIPGRIASGRSLFSGGLTNVLGGDCQPGFIKTATGQCVSLGGLSPSIPPGTTPSGFPLPASAPGMQKFLCRTLPDLSKVCDVSFDSSQAVMGRFGAALQPAGFNTWVRRCLPGMKLGKDGLCYDKISNTDRMWPKGRAPLLTGGEMRCISKAASAAKKLERTEKRLRSMGMIKKLPSGSRKPAQLPAYRQPAVQVISAGE